MTATAPGGMLVVASSGVRFTTVKVWPFWPYSNVAPLDGGRVSMIRLGITGTYMAPLGLARK